MKHAVLLMVMAWALPTLLWAEGRGIVWGDAIRYRVRMVTEFRVPAPNPGLEHVRVWHALPTVRSWDGRVRESSATELSCNPAHGRRQWQPENDSCHVFWKDEPLHAGRRYEWVSEFTVESPARSFEPSTATVRWRDYGRNVTRRSSVHADLEEEAQRLRAAYAPAQAVQEFCAWMKRTLHYDASVPQAAQDVGATLRSRRGHCAHYYFVLREFCDSVGIPIRQVQGLNLYAPDGRGELAAVRPDYVNIHTWAEVMLPGVGWVEVEPESGREAFVIPARYIQNNRWFQNYAVWIRQHGQDRIPEWTWREGRQTSPFGISHVITYRELPLPSAR